MFEFITFLKTVKNPVLVEHNIKTFDLTFLHNNLIKCQMWENFLSIVIGFVNTLHVFKKEFPRRGSYKQDVLINDLLHESYSAPSALDDVKALQKLTELVKPVLSKYMFGANLILNSVNAASHRITLKPLEDSKAITKTMASKIAKSGLNYDHLKMSCERVDLMA